MALISAFTQKDSPLRYLYGAWKQIGLTFRSLVVSAIALAIWYFGLWKNDISLSRHDTELSLLISAVILMLALLFIGGLALTEVLKRMQMTAYFILTKNEESFLLNRDERTSNAVLVFLGTTSILFVVQAMICDWESVWAGAFVVFVCSFIPAKFWVLITHLDNPMKSSKWIRERADPKLLKVNIDEHFKLGQYADQAAPEA